MGTLWLSEISRLPVIIPKKKARARVVEALFADRGELAGFVVVTGTYLKRRRYVAAGAVEKFTLKKICLAEKACMSSRRWRRAWKKQGQSPRPLVGREVHTEEDDLGRVSDFEVDIPELKLRRIEASKGFMADIVGKPKVLKASRIKQWEDEKLVVDLPVNMPKGGKWLEAAARTLGTMAGKTAKNILDREARALVGRKVGHSVTDSGGAIMAEEGATVTAEMVQVARDTGRLHELARAVGWGAVGRTIKGEPKKRDGLARPAAAPEETDR